MAKRGIRLAKEMSEAPDIKALLELCHTDPLNRVCAEPRAPARCLGISGRPAHGASW